MGYYDDKFWVKSYDPGVPAEVEVPETTLKAWWEAEWARHSDRAAFHYLGGTSTFGDLLDLSARFAKVLADAGLEKGDVVAVNLPNTPQYLVAVAGALRAGCAVSGVAPLLTADEIAYQLNDCGAKVLVTLDMLFADRYVKVADQTPTVELVLVAGVFDFAPGAEEFPSGQPLGGKTVQSFMEAIRGAEPTAPAVDVAAEDPCYLQYTGGTTGPPKGAVLTHRSMLANVVQFEAWLGVNRAQDVFLSGFPMFHQAGLFVATIALCWTATQVLIPDPRNTDHIIGEADKYKPTFLVNVPSLFLMLLAQPGFRSLDWSNLKHCVSGAAPFPVEGIRDLESVVGEGKMVEVYGMTETSPLITVNPAKGQAKIGSVGLPLPSTDFRIVSLGDGETQVPVTEEGEIICSGPQVMKGYLNRPTETANALREHDGKIWMHTGDIGRLDKDGFLFVVDRAKDMLNVGGYKVFSSEVESKMYEHPAIDLCAIVGVPHPDRPGSELVKLVVQKSAAYQDKSDEEVQEEIVALAKEKLAPYKIPKVFEFVAAIPLTSVGKVDKKKLR
jgi:acyl-CoA synthetase (AMP-forming)/AMP-acid ligase II